MAITPISINGVIWDEGSPGDMLRPAGAEVFQTGNPAGGDPGIVLVLNRSTQFPLSVHGLFAIDAVPNVYSYKGASVEVIRFGVTLQCVVAEARVTERKTVLDGVPKVSLAVTFDLIPQG